MFSFILTSLFLILIYIPTQFSHSPITIFKPKRSFIISNTTTNPYPVKFAYLISASKGDVAKLKRLLFSLYHPGNFYLIHLDLDAPENEHQEISRFVSENSVFGEINNVWVVGKPNLVTYRGPTMLATTLHAMAMLLKIAKWDWFINLSASDYPLVTQDGMVSTFFFVIFCFKDCIFINIFVKKTFFSCGVLKF